MASSISLGISTKPSERTNGAQARGAAAGKLLDQQTTRLMEPSNTGGNEFGSTATMGKGLRRDGLLAERVFHRKSRGRGQERPATQQKIDHRGNRIAGKAEYGGAIDAAGKDRLAWLDRHAEPSHVATGGDQRTPDMVGVAAGDAT